MSDDKIREEASQSAAHENPLADILSNPALLSQLGSIIKNFSAAAPPSTIAQSREQEPSPPVGNAAASGIEDGLSSILSNPAFLQQLPQLLSMAKPLLDNVKNVQPTTQAHTPEQDRNHLLLSLKPFLSKERQDAIESILRISQLGSILRQIQ